MLSVSQIAGFLNYLFLQNKLMRQPHFFACQCKFTKIKSWLRIFWLVMVKNRCGQFSLWTLKLNLSEDWTDGINCFFVGWYRFTKIKNWSNVFWVGMVKNDCGQSGHGTQKLTVSQKWADAINWFFACWYIFRKTKSWFNDF